MAREFDACTVLCRSFRLRRDQTSRWGIGDREQAKPINVVVGGSSKRGPPPPPPAGQPIPVTGEEFNAASKAEARRPEQ